MSRVLRRPMAERDLDDVWRYIAHDDMRMADAVLDRIETKLDRLARQPLLGTPRFELRPKLRSAPIGKYVCYYVPDANGIILLRVLHAARDLTPIIAAR